MDLLVEQGTIMVAARYAMHEAHQIVREAKQVWIEAVEELTPWAGELNAIAPAVQFAAFKESCRRAGYDWRDPAYEDERRRFAELKHGDRNETLVVQRDNAHLN